MGRTRDRKPKVTVDTETHRIGPGSIVPRLVLATFKRSGKAPEGMTTADALEQALEALLQPGTRLIFHNASFDLAVICKYYPRLEPLVWRKLELCEVSCTKIRMMLLNLSTIGKLREIILPDGSKQKLSYKLAVVAHDLLGIEMSEKDDPDSVRFHFDTWDGLPWDQVPRHAQAYALTDVDVTERVYDRQEVMIQSDHAFASCSSEPLHVAADFSLLWMTENGMAVDAERWRALSDEIADQLDMEKPDQQLLIREGLITPPQSARPHKSARPKAAAHISEWTGQPPETVTDQLILEFEAELRATGIRFVEPKRAKKNAKDIQETVAAACAHYGLEVKETDKGGVATSKGVMAELADQERYAGVPEAEQVFGAFQRYQSVQKIVTTELPRLTWEGQVADRVHFSYNVLVETGRTSSYESKEGKSKLYPSMNGQNPHPRIRPCLVATPGFLLTSTDYSTLELCCVAQVTYTLFGHSAHRDRLLAGQDLHAFLGASLMLRFGDLGERLAAVGGTPDDAYDLFLTLEKEDPDAYSFWRKFAKPFGLGFPGGLGPFKIIEFARAQYDVDIIEIAQRMRETDPDLFDEPSQSTMHYAKKLLKMDRGSFRWTPLLMGIQLAASVREAWMDTYPEMEEYFEYVSSMRDPNNPTLFYDEEQEREVVGLCYTTIGGMHRAAATFTAAANGLAMQSPAAEGAKVAMAELVRATRDPTQNSILLGCRVVNFIHDEFLVEVPDDGMVHERCMEIKRVMEESMSVVLSDVPIKATPCVMRRWDKRAKPVYVDGRLVVWEPKDKAA